MIKEHLAVLFLLSWLWLKPEMHLMIVVFSSPFQSCDWGTSGEISGEIGKKCHNQRRPRVRPISKVIIYKSSSELSLLEQCTTWTFGLTQGWKFMKTKLYVYIIFIYLNTTQNSKTGPNLKFYFLKRAHQWTLLEWLC